MLSSCNSGLKAKCQGDDELCSDVCSFMTAQEISRLGSATVVLGTLLIDWERSHRGKVAVGPGAVRICF